MLNWAITFLVIGLIAGALGLFGVAGAATQIAWILFVVFMVLFLVSLFVFNMQKKALAHANPNVFVRSVMGGMLIKMAVCVFAVIVYRLIAGKQVSKVSVFAAMFLYLLYLGVEVAVITKLNKQKNV